MSFKKKLKEYVLNYSNSYNFYKDFYEKNNIKKFNDINVKSEKFHNDFSIQIKENNISSSPNKRNILYVLHAGSTGGTFYTNLDLMKNVIVNFNVYLLGAEENELILYYFNGYQLETICNYPRNNKWSAKNFHDSWLNYIYYEILTVYEIDLIHIRHLINHSFDLPELANKLNIPVVLSFHDFYFICPFYLLLDENNCFCGGKCNFNDYNCKYYWDIFEDIHSKSILPLWRKNVINLFKYIDYFVTTAPFVKKLFLQIYKNENNLINENNFKIIEHGRDFTFSDNIYYEVPKLNNKIKIVCPANNLNETKGSEIIKNIKKLDVDDLIEFHFLGNNLDDLKDYGIIHGNYSRDNFSVVIEKIKPSFIAIFSIWPETFCHTITESWSCGIPVIGSNIGVIKDRILNNNGGILIDLNDLEKSYNLITSYVKNERQKDVYLNLINNVSKINFKTTKDMANEYEEIYFNLIKQSVEGEYKCL